ncbi:MAG: thiamine pyrophosphate-dependent enzyme [Thermoplasmata archaeon]|nr:thiamine pyrophosphate-dependent enzyme [Thermoplasmata archaeon]MCI4355792.1 thiamine pyrophosphate-dependent enzyme [Thermoplasmata archaeon]
MTEAPAVVPLDYTAESLEGLLGPEWSPTLVNAFRWMTLARVLDGRMLALQRQGRIGFYGPATGQEAVSVGAALSIGPDDWVFPGLREQLVALARGHSLTTYLHHLFANDLDPARGRQMPCHPTAREVRYVSMSSVIGTQVTHAVGLAYAMKLRRDPSVALAFFGDGATSANDFHAGANLAAVWQAPVVFCCTNNQWAISVPVEHQTRSATLAAKSVAYGMPGERVDGTDLVAVVARLRAAIAVARSGAGPSLLEFVVYRMTPHSSSDDPTRYQSPEFLLEARAHDPYLRTEALLRTLGLADDAQTTAWREESDAAVRAAIETAEAAPPPSPDSMRSDVLAPAPPPAPS